MDFVWLAVVTVFFAGSYFLIRLLTSLQGEA
jgi:hypothetical protein